MNAECARSLCRTAFDAATVHKAISSKERLSWEVEGWKPVRSLSRFLASSLPPFLPTRRPDDNSINALIYDSGGGDGDEGGDGGEVLRRANTQQKARHDALRRCVQAGECFSKETQETWTRLDRCFSVSYLNAHAELKIR